MSNKISALLIFLFFSLFYSLFSIGHFGGDGYGDYLTAESLVLDQNLSLYDRPNDPDELNYLLNVGAPGRDGKIYSSRSGIGMPVILSLFYFPGHVASRFLKSIPHDYITMFFVSFANPILSAFVCLFVFLIALTIGFNKRLSASLSFIYGLSTMAPIYTRTGFAEPAVTLFLLLAVYFMIKFNNSLKMLFLLLSAVAFSFSFAIKPNAAIFMPCFLFYLGWSLYDAKLEFREKLRMFILFVTISAVLFSTIMLFNWYIYGSIFKFGGIDAVHAGVRMAESNHFLKGIYYYLFSTGKGLFLFNLPLVLSFAFLKNTPRERRKEVVFFILIFLVNLLFFVKSFRRGSLFSWGPRYLLPSIPVLVLLLGVMFYNYAKLFRKIVLFFFSAAGALVMLPCLFINQSKFYFFVKERLGIDEYLINFIPDLSPILGAWKMFISKISFKLFHVSQQFVYNPDYKLISPVAAKMDGYNNFDFWFIKIVNLAPKYNFVLIFVLIFMLALMVMSLYFLIKRLSK